MKKDIKITYLKKADKFLKKHSNTISEDDVDNLVILAVKKIVFELDVNINLKTLKGNLKGKYRIRKGKIRVIIDIQQSEIIIESIIEDINFRGNIYN